MAAPNYDLVKVQIWEELYGLPTKSGPKRKMLKEPLLTDAMSDIAKALQCVAVRRYPFGERYLANEPLLREAARLAMPGSDDNGIRLYSVVALAAKRDETGDGVTSLSSLLSRMDKPLLPSRIATETKAAAERIIEQSNVETVIRKMDALLDEQCNETGWMSATLKEYLYAPCRGLMLCGAVGDKKRYGQFEKLVRAIPVGLVIGQMERTDVRRRPQYVALVA